MLTEEDRFKGWRCTDHDLGGQGHFVAHNLTKMRTGLVREVGK